MKYKNDKDHDGKFNYVYKITNMINKKIYIGVHRTNNIHDGYMGSGRLIKRAIEKYGIENFIREILKFFKSYKEALEYEKVLVTPEFCESKHTYNLKEGGHGSCYYSKEYRENISKSRKEKWQDPEFREMMIQALNTDERKKRLSENIKKYIENNQDEFQERMLRINKNPEKIQKMAKAHTGMKRSNDTKKNLSDAKKLYIAENGTDVFGKGMKYIHNPITKQRKRVEVNSELPDGWLWGIGESVNKGKTGILMFIKNIECMLEKTIKKGDPIPEGWVKGRLKRG